ncbi:hypothetical protein VP01_281g9 [Puccinia sorghi]|uniref:Uncharacterized protein n=1 Tax=Puccinia sorghi TaxID=27349 RepID=A0A0L6V335_9BASI|nr:hypothetical protein VP01_281g9 [Puccinia sorghi]
MAAMQKNQEQPTQFNSSDSSKFLHTRHTVAMEALVASTPHPHDKPELYKPPGATNTLSGTWGSGKCKTPLKNKNKK